MKRLSILARIIMLFLLSVSVAYAADVTPATPIAPTVSEVAINNGANDQRDTHISGTLVTYTDDTDYAIHYHNFASGQGGTVPKPAGTYDQLSEVNGSTIVFSRTGGGELSVYTFDVNAPGSGAQEIAPQSTMSFRRNPAVGNGTIAWEDGSFGSSTASFEIMVYDTASGSLTRVTNDLVQDREPALSPDGSTLVWTKCASDKICDVWQATRADNWQARQLTGGANQPNGEEWHVDTNGTIVVYNSIRNGEDDLYWQAVGGGPETRLVMPGWQYEDHIAGDLISFDVRADLNSQSDIYVYDLATGLLYRLTDTPVEEMHNDISIGPDGKVNVVWARFKPANPYDLDIYGISFARQPRASLGVQPLFDQTRSYKLGSVVPIKLQVLNAQGRNISSSSLVVHATGALQKDNTAASLTVESPGAANPDNDFRYDATLSGYLYNLSTKNLSVGTWELQFKVGSDPTIYRIAFDLR